MNQHRIWTILVLAVLLSGCGQPSAEQPRAASSTPSAPATSATPTPSGEDAAHEVDQAMGMYRTLAEVRWTYVTARDGLGPDDPTPPELTDLLTGDALDSEVAYLKRWRAQGWSVVSGMPQITWLRDLNNSVEWGASVLVIQACNDATGLVTSDAAGKRFSNKASVTTIFFELVDGKLRISYFDRTTVAAVAACP